VKKYSVKQNWTRAISAHTGSVDTMASFKRGRGTLKQPVFGILKRNEMVFLLKLSRTARRGYFINGIENFWSCAKRRLSKFNGVKINFELHLKECEWRYRKDSALLEMKLKKIVKCYLNS